MFLKCMTLHIFYMPSNELWSFLKTFVYLLCWRAHICHGVEIKWQWGGGLFYPMGPEDQTQTIRITRKHLFLLSKIMEHLCSIFFFKEMSTQIIFLSWKSILLGLAPFCNLDTKLFSYMLQVFCTILWLIFFPFLYGLLFWKV